MIQAQDARVANLLANDPSVLPYIVPKDTDFETLAPLTFDHCFTPEGMERYRFFHNDDETIGMLYCWSSPDIWELHMMALPTARGGEALRFAEETVAHMFNDQGARELWGQTPIWNERARFMHRKVGGISRGFGHQPMFGEVELFATSKGEWLDQR